MSTELNNYIQAQLAAGTDEASIKQTLLETGWDQSSIDAAFSNSKKPPIDQPTESTPAMKEEPMVESKQPRLTPYKPTHQKGLLVTIIVIVVALFVGGGAWAYVTFFSQPSPEEVLASMQTSMAELDSYSYNTELNLDLTVPEEELQAAAAFLPITSGKFTIGIAGSAYMQDEKEFADAKISISNEGTELFNFEERILDSKIFYKVNSINVPLLNLFVNTNKLTQNWLTIDINEVIDTLGDDQELLSEFDFQETRNQFMALEDKYAQKEFFILKEVYENEKINDVATYHYLVDIKKETFNELITDVFDIIIDEDPTVGENDLQEFKDMYNDITIPSFDLWIGKKDFNLYKARTQLTFRDLGISEVNEVFEPQDMMSIEMMFSNFNKPVTIEEPENAKTIEEFMEELGGDSLLGAGLFGQEPAEESLDATLSDDLFGSPLITGDNDGPQGQPEDDPNFWENSDGSSRPNLWGNSITGDNDGPQGQPEDDPNYLLDTDEDGLTDYDEINLYGTNPNSYDTDNDGYTDGDEVEAGYNPNGPGKL